MKAKNIHIVGLFVGLMCILMSCERTTVGFSYTPACPRAGETVRFTNTSSDGEEWAWSFGDAATSESRSPSHTYKQPGTYTVSLQVDKKKSLTKVEEITVYDTIPTFSCSDSIVRIFENVTFKALVYNPYSYTIRYRWEVLSDGKYKVLSDTNTLATYSLYFEQVGEISLRLTIEMNGETFVAEKSVVVVDKEGATIAMRTVTGDYTQRMFANSRYEEVKESAEVKELLDATQDTMQVFNNQTFSLSSLKGIIPNIEGFRIVNRKLYYRANGLYVSHLDGSQAVQIESLPTSALAVDGVENKLYWAVSDSVLCMPLVGAENNQFKTEPVTLNHLQGVEKIALKE